MAEAEEGDFTENEMTEEDEEDQEEMPPEGVEEVEDQEDVEETQEEKVSVSDKASKATKASVGSTKSDRPEDRIPDSSALQGRIDEETLKKLQKIEKDAKESANIIFELKTKVKALLEKEQMTEDEAKELEEINIELRNQLLLFDDKTKLIQDIIANSNILDGMPSRLPKVAYSEDVLPRVILCGIEQDNVPKIVVCDQNNKPRHSTSKQCEPECPGPSPLPQMPSFMKNVCEDFSTKSELDNAKCEIQRITSKLEEEICNKDRVFNQLQEKLTGLQNEIRMVTTENAMLNDKIRRIQNSQAKQQSCQPNKMCPATLSAKLQEYSIYTRQLEMQLFEMEQDFMQVQRQVCAAEKERERLKQQENMMGRSPSCRKR